jgi:hypothetical protein
MRILKHLIIGVIGLVVLLTLISFLFSSTISFNREVYVNASQKQVQTALTDLKTWPRWFAPLGTGDVQGQIVFKPREILWMSTNDVTTSSVVMRHVDTAVVEFNLSSNRRVECRLLISTSTGGKQTRIEWQSLVHLGSWPWEKFSGMVAEKMVAPAIEASLKNFKAFIESDRNRLANNSVSFTTRAFTDADVILP